MISAFDVGMGIDDIKQITVGFLIDLLTIKTNRMKELSKETKSDKPTIRDATQADFDRLARM